MSSSFITVGTNSEIKKESIYTPQAEAIIADHLVVNYVRLDLIPELAIIAAKNLLHIAYGHTSHGSQITTGMSGLVSYKEGLGGTEGLYEWNNGGTSGALDLHDYFMEGDLGNPDRTTWASRTRTYLDNPANVDVNVVMWSWCGQAATSNPADIVLYLDLMTELEEDYPSVKFIYMTGHTDGSGLEGDLHLRNEEIRNYCRNNGKILYDFEDIESYDPSWNYFGDKFCNDECEYDSNNDSIVDANWAIQWQNAHPEQWYKCTSEHTKPLNANMKAYAAWWLWATLAGWNTTYTPTPSPFTPPSNIGLFNITGKIIVGSLISLATIQLLRKKK